MAERLPEWVEAWRRGIAPLAPHDGLVDLREAVLRDDPRLLQHVTALGTEGGACAGACGIGWALWKGDGLEKAEDVQQAFNRVVTGAGIRMGWKTAVAPFFKFFDET